MHCCWQLLNVVYVAFAETGTHRLFCTPPVDGISSQLYPLVLVPPPAPLPVDGPPPPPPKGVVVHGPGPYPEGEPYVN